MPNILTTSVFHFTDAQGWMHVGTRRVGQPLGRLENWQGTPLKPPCTATGSPLGCTPTGR
ncbi:unnamed protein product [Prunus armeniaca]